MYGYLRGLSSPSVTDASTTRACSPRANKAGQNRVPTFSLLTNHPPAGAGRAHQVDRENAPLPQLFTVLLGQPVVLGQHLLFQLDGPLVPLERVVVVVDLVLVLPVLVVRMGMCVLARPGRPGRGDREPPDHRCPRAAARRAHRQATCTDWILSSLPAMTLISMLPHAQIALWA